MSIYIKYIPRDKLLYNLWCNAKTSHYFRYCLDKAPVLTLKQTTDDINNMLSNGVSVAVTSYYGRLLYVKLTGDLFDPFLYDSHNGNGTAEKIITKLKLEELQKTILNYYKFF